MSDRKAELERKKAKLEMMRKERQEKERQRKQKEVAIDSYSNDIEPILNYISICSRSMIITDHVGIC